MYGWIYFNFSLLNTNKIILRQITSILHTFFVQHILVPVTDLILIEEMFKERML